MADMKKVELLAPAGNFDALKGAVNAGADAVYLGGALYGARAYAENFTQDEICTGIHLAHVFDRKIYLTVNTLIKEKELDELYNFLLPFYECGLDGVIVQDLGVLRFIRNHFPELSIHASTQMALTGSEGASFIKKEGVSRIVPARELSLAEIKSIKQNTGLEIEAFIHGAMCYCYSGQCLFSSILGGRSGNRGRCAQPCRLPYEVNTIDISSSTSVYPLSMRDMCTISMLPELIEAGIDSFKIEGRMKKPAYAAGVTAVYRKYIDLYYEEKEDFQVEQADMERLKSLYIRSQIGNGYYQCHNGREMISFTSPAYSGSDEKLLEEIRQKYIDSKLCHEVTAKVCLKEGEPSRLMLSKGEVHASCRGDVVQKALKQPLSKEKVRDQIKKSGNSLVKITQVELEMDDDIFLPVSALNELRRKTTDAFEKEMIRQNGFHNPLADSALLSKEGIEDSKAIIPKDHDKQFTQQLHAAVNTKAQLWAALNESVERIYLDYSLLCEEVCKELKRYKDKNDFRTKLYLITPYIVRERNISCLERIKRSFADSLLFEGVLVRNLESYRFLTKQEFAGKIVLDANLYLWNHEAVAFWEERAEEFYLPVECNLHEWKELLQHCSRKNFLSSAIVYGRLPMMITANCLNRTSGKCSKTPQIVTLKDRYGKQFPVYTDCLSCYNIIYNSVPLSLHKLFENKDWLNGNFRLDFTIENETETSQIIKYFKELFKCYKAPFYKEYTTGHLKRGVE